MEKYVDPLLPFDDKENRDEYLLVEYDNIIVNSNYCELLYIQSHIKDIPSLSTIIEEIFKLPRNEIFLRTSLFTNKEFYSKYLKVDLSKEIMTKIKSETDYTNNEFTYVLAQGFSRLVEISDKIKMIFITMPNYNNRTQMESLKNLYTEDQRLKIIPLTKSPKTILGYNEGITTTYINDIDDAYDIIKDESIEKDKMQFIVSKLISNVEIDNNNSVVAPYKHMTEIDEFCKNNKCNILLIQQYAINNIKSEDEL